MTIRAKQTQGSAIFLFDNLATMVSWIMFFCEGTNYEDQHPSMLQIDLILRCLFCAVLLLYFFICKGLGEIPAKLPSLTPARVSDKFFHRWATRQRDKWRECTGSPLSVASPVILKKFFWNSLDETSCKMIWSKAEWSLSNEIKDIY